MEAAITEFNERFSAGNMDLVVRQQDVTDMSFSTIDERVGRQIALADPGGHGLEGAGGSRGKQYRARVIMFSIRSIDLVIALFHIQSFDIHCLQNFHTEAPCLLCDAL